MSDGSNEFNQQQQKTYYKNRFEELYENGQEMKKQKDMKSKYFVAEECTFQPFMLNPK